KIEVPSVLGDVRKPDNPREWDFFIDKPNKIAFLRLNAFTKTSADDIKHDLVQLQKEGMRGLVLDLRNNPGGLLKSAVDISNLFLDEGRIVSTKGRNQKEDIYDVDPAKTLLPAKDCAVAILINRGSASASEILAAALQDHNRAVIIGERSYGKGGVQNIVNMEDGNTGLEFTTARYWRAGGTDIPPFARGKRN